MKIALSRISIRSLFSLCELIINGSETSGHELVGNHALLTILKAEYERYDAVYGKKGYSGMGKKVAAANLLRTETYAALRLILRGYAKAEGFSGQADARQLLTLFTLRGSNVYQDSYFSKSTFFRVLLQRLELPENKAIVERLHLTEMFGLLKASVDNFEKLNDEQMSANAKLHIVQSATVQRKGLEKALRNFLDYITAMRSVAEDWERLYLLIDEFVKSARHSHRTKKDVTPEEEATSEAAAEIQ